jgi:predicted RNA-binding Zn-ribbon protein involved in translation (DUF1610 family)
MPQCSYCNAMVSSCISYTENKVVGDCRIENGILVEVNQVFTNLVEFRCPECGAVLFKDGQTEELTNFLRGE